MKIKVSGKRPFLIHAVADCHDCSWSEHDYKKCVQAARRHAQKTGHNVLVETGYYQEYNEK